jgi:hypothetical protein
MTKLLQDQIHLSSSRKRFHFTEIEDRLIKETVTAKGSNCWKELEIILNRSSKQIRDRYNHYLKKPVRIESWSLEEDQLLINLMKGELKQKWFNLEKHFKGRNQIQIKNRWIKLSKHQQIQSQNNHSNSDSISNIPAQHCFHILDFDYAPSNSFQIESFQGISISPSQQYYKQSYPIEQIEFQPNFYNDESIYPLSSLLNRPAKFGTEQMQHKRLNPIETFFL